MNCTDSGLYVMKPDRSGRYSRIEGPVLDERGNHIEIFDGATIDRDVGLVFRKTKRGEVGDFVYNIGLLLLLTERAYGVVSRFNLGAVDPVQVSLVDQRGARIQLLTWLNIRRFVPLLDLSGSDYRGKRAASGVLILREVRRFVVREDVEVDYDIFGCQETSSRIFSERLVSEIRRAGLSGGDFVPLDGSTWPIVRGSGRR